MIDLSDYPHLTDCRERGEQFDREIEALIKREREAAVVEACMTVQARDPVPLMRHVWAELGSFADHAEIREVRAAIAAAYHEVAQ